MARSRIFAFGGQPDADDAGAQKDDDKRVPERLRHKERSVDDKTDKNEAARAKQRERTPQLPVATCVTHKTTTG